LPQLKQVLGKIKSMTRDILNNKTNLPLNPLLLKKGGEIFL
jgi:hypothetical protein